MRPKQVIARDLRAVLRELRGIMKAGKLEPMVASLLERMIRLVELLLRQTLQL
jgi:hypothetical protein